MYAKYFISYRPPHRVIDEYGYNVEYMHHFLTSMHGTFCDKALLRPPVTLQHLPPYTGPLTAQNPLPVK
jgi:hypothetical protein